MDAYDVMREWDRVIGLEPRSDEVLDKEVPKSLGAVDYEEWKAGLEARNVDAILKGMRCWGLPVEPLAPFAMDEHVQTMERPD